MNQISSSTQLKTFARTSLIGHYPFLIGLLCTSQAITLLLQLFIPSMPAAQENAADINGIYYVLYFLIYYIVSVTLEILRFRICRIYLMICCQVQPTFRDLFLGNPDRAKERLTVSAAACITLLQMICMLPAQLLINFNSISDNSVLFLLTCIACVAGLIIYGCLYFGFFPLYYLVADCPAPTFKETLHLAFYLSKGNRFRLFYLTVGFLPLVLLSLLSCGIGLLWIIPYMNATLTHYYLNLASCKSA